MGILVASRPEAVRVAPERGAEPVTEVVAGEHMEVQEDRGSWLRVVAPDHATHLDPRGYPGWVRAEIGMVIESWTPDLKVISPNPAKLPLGALLESSGEEALLPTGEKVVPGEAALPVGEAVGLSAVEVSCSLLGLSYRWAGTDSTTGMDCSGLVYRVMQLLGVRVPRDADDQYEAAPFKSRESWKEARDGDLVFFGEGVITHVGFYLGGGLYVSEHGSGGTVVRGVEEDPYWGYARYEGHKTTGDPL